MKKNGVLKKRVTALFLGIVLVFTALPAAVPVPAYAAEEETANQVSAETDDGAAGETTAAEDTATQNDAADAIDAEAESTPTDPADTKTESVPADPADTKTESAPADPADTKTESTTADPTDTEAESDAADPTEVETESDTQELQEDRPGEDDAALQEITADPQDAVRLKSPAKLADAGDIEYETWTGHVTIGSNTTREKRVRVSGDVTLTISEGATLTAKMGISVTSGNSLTIDGNGTLRSELPSKRDRAYKGYAGIGGDPASPDSGRITINEGTVIATGGAWAAGIGGGYNADAEGNKFGIGRDITINGGNVTATGGDFGGGGMVDLGAGAGIGGSSEGPGLNIIINGGTVRASGGKTWVYRDQDAAGIGAGYGCAWYEVTIHGGKVTAGPDNAYFYEEPAAAIGSGRPYYSGGFNYSQGTFLYDGGQVTVKTTIGGAPENYTKDDHKIYLNWTDKNNDSIRAAGYHGLTGLMKEFIDEGRTVYRKTPNNTSMSDSEREAIANKTLMPALMHVTFMLDEETPYADAPGAEGGVIDAVYGTNIIYPMDPASDYGTFLGWYRSWHEEDAASASDRVDFSTPVDGDMTLYAGWSRAAYTITYKAGQNGLGEDVSETVLSGSTYTLKENTALENGGFLPVFGYSFRNWREEGQSEDIDPGYTFTVTGDRTFVGQWGQPRYRITFLNDDGTVIKTTYAEPGTYWGAIDRPADPTKEPDAQYTYTFRDWTPTPAIQVTGNATYTADYTKTLRKYKVIFREDPNIEDYTYSEKEYDYGTRSQEIEKPVDPENRTDNVYRYTFTGWTPEIEDVTGDATYTAAYTRERRKFEVRWYDQDGTKLDPYSTMVTYGDQPTHDEPQKEGDAQYTYTFAGWAEGPGRESGTPAEDLPDVTGRATY